MMRVLEGKLNGSGLKIAIVAARFNALITEKLLSGALGTFKSLSVNESDITLAWVPGAFELPWMASRLAKSGQFDAVITLGCVIRGETTHYDYVCNEAAKGVSQAAQNSGIPVIFGVLTTENMDQALARAGCKAGNKGSDAAMAAIEMANLSKLCPLT